MRSGLSCNSILFVLVISMLVVPTLTTSSGAQTQVNNGWTTYTSEKCKVSFEYPSNWVLKVKGSPFGTNMTSEIELYNPQLDLTRLYPAFSVGGCEASDVIYSGLPSALFLGNKTIHDAKSLSIIGESIATFGFNIASAYVNLDSNSTYKLEFNMVEHTRLSPKFVGNEETGKIAKFSLTHQRDILKKG